MGETSVRATVDADLLKVDWNGLLWFGAKLGRATLRFWRVEGNGPCPPAIHVCIAQAFARDIKDDGLVFGAGIGQIEQRHLLYVGASNGRPHACVGFCWLTRAKP